MNTENYKFMQNRELSWLRFNERVLNEAKSEDVPLYERLKFVSIFLSNLDEFFMVRVGSIFDLSIANKKVLDNKTGLTPKEQLDKIYSATTPLYVTKDKIYKDIMEELKKNNLIHLKPKDLTADEFKYVKDYFNNYVQPILSPQLVDEHHQFPFISSKQLCVIGKIEKKKNELLAIVQVPNTLPPLLFMPGKKIRYMNIEDIIFMYFENIFKGYNITNKNIFCATRNADINPNDEAYEINEDFRSKMKKVLKKRKRLAVIRIEAAYNFESYTKKLLCTKLGIEDYQIFITKTPIHMKYVLDLQSKLSLDQKNKLCYKDFTPQVIHKDIMSSPSSKDILISYPYESMSPFIDLIKRSAYDKDVVSIKITIYRLAKNAKLIEHLCTAAENGKEVLVLIELRARFDEQNNIDWSERLEQAGCIIIYGLEDYKVHSKICLITKKINNQMSYITQIGTGNYNEKTAKQYTDLSLITQNKEIGEDAVNFFSNISISNLGGDYKHLWVAPNSMKSKIIYYIDKELKKGNDGEIFIKVNSVTDKKIICKLQEASQAGVKITMLVRGICCLLPNVSGLTENITIYSIVGRFLEHTRIYRFGKGDQQELFISSADIMTRNMECRVEVGCPIYSEEIKEIINHNIDISLSDTTKIRVLTNDGTYIMKDNVKSTVVSQDVFLKEALSKRNKMELLESATSVINQNNTKKLGFFRTKYNNLITKLYNKIENKL